MENKDNLEIDNEDILDGELLAKMVRGGAAQLRSNAREVNDLNVFPVPDGDTGDNMRLTIEGGVAALEGMHTSNLADVMDKLSEGMLLGARGNSGVILSQFFAGMKNGFENCERADAATVAHALGEGVKQAYASVITPTEGTVLTVAREAVEYACQRLNENSTMRTLFADLIEEMYNSLQRTPEILTVLKDAGVVDSGGAGLFYIMQGCYKILMGEDIEEAESASLPAAPAPTVDLSAFGPDDEMTYGYCTELILQLQHSKCDIDAFSVDILTDYLKTIGDSIAAFKTGSRVKIHVHTKTPERVIERCRQYGELLTVKIENMSVQHNSKIIDKQQERENVTAAKRKRYASVAVASGEGIGKTFKELGVDAVIAGGQTQNPSSQDFLSSFERVNADVIYVFPNNGNIVMAAKQAAQLYKDSRVYVVESKDLGMGYAAISSINYQCDDPDAIFEQLSEAMSAVTTGCISPAIRDCELDGVHIECGDHIGFIGKSMRVSRKSVLDACLGLLDSMELDSGDIFALTVFYGKDAAEDDINRLEKIIGEKYPEIELYPVYGMQDIYPYIFVAE